MISWIPSLLTKPHGFFDLRTQALYPKHRSCPDDKLERKAVRESADGEARAGLRSGGRK